MPLHHVFPSFARFNVHSLVPCRPGAFVLFLLATLALHAAEAPQPTRRTWTVDGVLREALVCRPAQTTAKPTPVVFAFHGHGGNMRNVARTWRYHALWPEAIVVYPQGLPTRGQLTDPAGLRSGWQPAAGTEGDRDLKFFDAMLTGLRREFRIDDRRIYATGHSNGGGFTYLLWAERGEQFAAMAPSSSVAGRSLGKLQPKPAWHLAGRNDELVKFEWQQQMIAAVRRLNACDSGVAAADGTTRYASQIDAPLVTLIHDGGHEFPAARACPLIVAFFQQHPKQ